MNNGCQRRRGEPPRAYQAYRVYRDLGPNRSLARAWRVDRETRPAGAKSRGRPRLAHAEARHPSGQWTTWSSLWQWAERAAEYDAHVDAKKRRARLERIQELERQRSQVELEFQERLEELVYCLEAQLDKMNSLPITGYTVWKREVDGKNVTASKTQVQGINLFGYARLLRQANEIASLAIVGVHAADKRSRTFGDPFTAGSLLNTPSTDSNSSFTGSTAEDSPSVFGPDRLPGESAPAYRAFCAYRDQGPQRSLAAAWMADRQNSDPATRARRRGQGTLRASAGHWPEWSSQWNWVARAAASDAIVGAAQRQAQRYRREQIEQRRIDFLFANQERLETRIEKTGAFLSKGVQAPILDITRWTKYALGKRVHKTKTHVEGLNVAGWAELSHQYKETMRQAVGGGRKNRRDLGGVLSSLVRDRRLMITSGTIISPLREHLHRLGKIV